MNKLFFIFLVLFSLTSCENKLSDAEKKYYESIIQYRIDKDNFMQNDPSSPFNAKGKVPFSKLKYFDINLKLRFKSKLMIYESQDTIVIYGTKGEPRKTIRFGYLNINYRNHNYKINVYKSRYDDLDYYSIWFTDKTTNKESYGVGRYLDFELNEDLNYEYDIDFNLSYNPYCAYTHSYSCAIPSKEDYLDIEVNAGEKIFHE